MAVPLLSPLESLPTEIIVLVLSAAARSPADLGSLIRTSSTIHACFKSFKVDILTAPALQDLGPAIIEAIALSRLGPLKPLDSKSTQDPLMENVFQDYARHYHQLTSSSSATRVTTREPWKDSSIDLQWVTREVTEQMAESILHLNVAVQFFADLYLATRLSNLQNQISVLEERISPLTTSDRDELSCARALRNATSHSERVEILLALHPAMVPTPQNIMEAGRISEKVAILRALHSAMMSPRDSNTSSLHVSQYSNILSPLERTRLCQSFLRVQLLVTISRLGNGSFWNVPIRDNRVFHPSPAFMNTPVAIPSTNNEDDDSEDSDGPRPDIPTLVAKIMYMYNPWEMEQISQAHHFGYTLATCVQGVDDWHTRTEGFITNRMVSDIVRMRWRAKRERLTEITTKCQFDLVDFRRRLLKGGAGVCLGLEQIGPQRDGAHGGGCLAARGFDSVRIKPGKGDGQVEASTSANRTTEAGTRRNPKYEYRPIPVPSPASGTFDQIVQMDVNEKQGRALPVSREYHGKAMKKDDAFEDDCNDGYTDEQEIMVAFFGPGPGSPQNVHPLEGHIGLRLLLHKGQGRSNGTCMATERTNIQWLCASHRYEASNSGWPRPGRPSSRDETLDGSESDDVASSTSKSSLLPKPYAWTDALDGMVWDRWGMDFLYPCPGDQVDNPDDLVRSRLNPRRGEVEFRFARWRFLGLVFWDEERVREVKRALGDYKTGWLNRVWDE